MEYSSSKDGVIVHSPKVSPWVNSKHEIRNPKQYQITKLKIQNVFKICILEIRICFEFRYSNFEFIQSEVLGKVRNCTLREEPTSYQLVGKVKAYLGDDG